MDTTDLPFYLFWSQNVAGLILVGLIWTIQVVHYPSFHQIDESQFLKFHQSHSLRISCIVIPPMLTELFCLGFLVYLSPEIKYIILLSLVLAIWISTFFVQVPIHNRLGRMGKKTMEINYLINSNWFRTVLWTVKSVLCLVWS
ncbi:MAG: hypothetical protein O9301_06380 [Leptospira sp.]|nr:hypothetical protein [Leptospira sp.]